MAKVYTEEELNNFSRETLILYWNYRMFWRHQALYVSQEWRQSQSIP